MHERKEENPFLGSLLKPKDGKSLGCLRQYKVEIDKHSLELINKVNPLTTPLFTIPISERSSRHPFIAYIDPENKIIHARAILGFSSFTDIEQKKEFIKSVVELLNCNEADVAVPDTSLITGVVHQQLIDLIAKQEPELANNKKLYLIGFSLTQTYDVNEKRHVFHWIGRSAFNMNSYDMQEIAAAVYAIDKERPKSQTVNLYPLGFQIARSIIIDDFQVMSELLTDEIFKQLNLTYVNPRITIDDYTEEYKNKWKNLIKLINEDKMAANVEIQQAIMRNLYFYLNYHVGQLYYENMLDILVKGIKAVERLGMKIDLAYVPDEFKDEEALAQKLYNGFCKIMQSRGLPNVESAKLFLEVLPSADMISFLNAEVKKLSIPSVDFFLNRYAALLLGDKSELDKQFGEKKETLLQLAINFSMTDPLGEKIYKRLLFLGADPNISNKDGLSLLYHAVKENRWDLASELLEKKADPNMGNKHISSPLEIAIESPSDIREAILSLSLDDLDDQPTRDRSAEKTTNFQLSHIKLLLSHNALFSDDVDCSSQLAGIVKDIIYAQDYETLDLLINAIDKHRNAEIKSKYIECALATFRQSIDEEKETQFSLPIIMFNSKEKELRAKLLEMKSSAPNASQQSRPS